MVTSLPRVNSAEAPIEFLVRGITSVVLEGILGGDHGQDEGQRYPGYLLGKSLDGWYEAQDYYHEEVQVGKAVELLKQILRYER